MGTIKRLGSLGAGGHARLSHFAMHENAVLAAVFDPSPASIEETLKLVGGNVVVCNTPQELLAHPIDAVLIMGPDDTHPELLEMAVAAGKPVLCENPWRSTQKVWQELTARSRQPIVKGCLLPAVMLGATATTLIYLTGG